jgi:lincosamide nucleotidyltransferase A/C/D/E
MTSMSASDVLAVLGLLRRSGLVAYVGGGWGVDALLGEQGRPHDDLDLSIDARDEARVLEVLEGEGFVIVLDQRPTRLVLRNAAGLEVVLHPVAFDASGAGVQIGFDGPLHYPADGFTSGTIGGEQVGCFSIELQVRFHSGYIPNEKNRHDMRLLAERFGVRLPTAYE